MVEIALDGAHPRAVIRQKTLQNCTTIKFAGATMSAMIHRICTPEHVWITHVALKANTATERVSAAARGGAPRGAQYALPTIVSETLTAMVEAHVKEQTLVRYACAMMALTVITVKNEETHVSTDFIKMETRAKHVPASPKIITMETRHAMAMAFVQS